MTDDDRKFKVIGDVVESEPVVDHMPTSQWTPNKIFSGGEVVGKYKCLLSHLSSDNFNADIAAGYWYPIDDAFILE